MWATILGAITAFLEAIPILSRLISKTPTQKVDEENSGVDDAIAKADKTGRPQL
jgi:hypothetical protein